MAYQYQKRTEFDLKGKQITICSFCSPEQISSLSFENTFTKYPSYNPIISSKKTLTKAAEQPDTNVTLAFNTENEVFGFAVLEFPTSENRWVKVGEKIMMEVSLIEISRPWRSLGVSQKLFDYLLDHPQKESRIMYMVGYSWTWDLEGSGLQPMEYRGMLIKLFKTQGFNSVQTNEPNVLLRPENLFMARIGTNITEKIKKRFNLVKFNIDPNIDD